MDKQLINHAWACLPYEYREEIKRMWHNEKESLPKCTAGYIFTEVFGYNNLTSEMDEEDEILTVSRQQVQKIYQNNCKEIGRENVSSSDKDCYETVNETLKTLFGSKCLPGLKNKMRFEVGNNVVFHPFKSNSFYDAEILEIKENVAKPYLLRYGDNQEIWVYPIEVQSLAETYHVKNRPCDNPLVQKCGCKYKDDNDDCVFDCACYFEPIITEDDEMANKPFSDYQAQSVYELRKQEHWNIVSCKYDMHGPRVQDLYSQVFDHAYSLGQIASTHSNNLKSTYEACCEEYRRCINEQWELNIRDSWWIPTDRAGMTLALCDLEYSLSMEDVRLMVDLGISYKDFNDWWNHCLSDDPEDYHINAYNWFVNKCRPKDIKH